MLVAQLKGAEPGDFQDLAAWRRLVPQVAHEIMGLTGDDLVCVQTVLRDDYLRELRDGFAACGIDVFHVMLDIRPDVLRARIEADEVEAQARSWRLDHVETWESARPRLIAVADLVIDAGINDAGEVAEAVLRTYTTRSEATAPGPSLGGGDDSEERSDCARPESGWW